MLRPDTLTIITTTIMVVTEGMAGTVAMEATGATITTTQTSALTDTVSIATKIQAVHRDMAMAVAVVSAFTSADTKEIPKV